MRKILAFAMAAALSLTAFAGCSRRDDDLTVSPPAPVESAPGIVSDIEEGARDLESDVERGVSELEEDFDISRDESRIDEDDLRVDEEESRLNDVSRAELLPGASELTDESVAAAMSTDFNEIGALNAAKDTGFPGGPVDAKNRPSGPLAYQTKYNQYNAMFIVPDSNKFYLTFDEGYENGYTSKILDILKEKNVKAVFFITYPYAKSEPALVRRMIEEGHTLGNHSTKHFVYPDMPLTEAAKDLKTLHDYVLAQYGYEMTLFRPPEGAFSEQTLALAQSLGYTTMLWSFAYKDYDVQNQPNTIEATNTILSKAHPGEICLLHAVSRTNSEILGDVIDQLKARNFKFADYFYFQ